MRSICLALFLLTACAVLAQPQGASLTPQISFEQRWPSADPQWFKLDFQPDGSATYHSLPHLESTSASDDPVPEPFELSFNLSPQSRQLIFALAPQLPRFQGSLDKVKVAFTGTKTLRYEDGAGNSSVLSYNYSSSPELAKLTELMQGISESIEYSQTLQFQIRFDKLALDTSLRRMEDLIADHRLPERQLLQPILQRIANDPTIMNIARQRARHILQTPATK
jgi:hypothetical protein